MKTIKRIEIFLFVLILAAITAKSLKFIYSEVALVVSMTLLIFLYWIMAFQNIQFWKMSKASSLVNISLYLIMSFSVLSIMFTLMFWQGGYDILLQMSKLMIFLCVFSAVYSIYKYKDDKYILWKSAHVTLRKTVSIIIIGFILYLIPFESRIEIFSIDPVAYKARLEMNSH